MVYVVSDIVSSVGCFGLTARHSPIAAIVHMARLGMIHLLILHILILPQVAIKVT
jgi:hypothetical protein